MPSNSRSASILLFFALLPALTACHPAEPWKEAQSKAEQAKLAGDKKAAIKYYSQAVKQMESAHAPGSDELKALMQLGLLLLEDKSYSEADKYGQKALSIAERVYGPDDINLMPHLVQMQRVCEGLPDKVRVNEYMLKVIELQEKRTGPESVPVMWLLDQYARSKSPSCGDSFDVKRLRQLVRLRDKFSSPDNVDTLRDKIILASVLSQTGEMKESLEIYADCLQKSRKKCPGLLPELLLSYSKALTLNKQTDRSLTLLEEAYKLAGSGKSFNPIVSPEIAGDLGYLLELKNRKAEAAMVYEAVISELKTRNNTGKLAYFENSLKNCK